MSGTFPVRHDLDLFDGYHSPQVEVAVRLNTNESPYPPPAELVTTLSRELRNVPFHRYPDREARSLRAALAEAHGVSPGQVFCANGSNEILQLLLLSYGGPGRKAAVFEPTYALHSHIARVTATEVVAGDRDERFRVELESATKLLTEEEPALTFLCSPNNPTGGAELPGVVEALAARVPGLLVVDEAYGQFASWSALSLVAASERIAVVRTFSKTWAMAALRLGYVVAPEAVVSALEKVALPYHLDGVKQLAGVLSLRYRAEMERRVASIVEERGRILSELTGMAVECWPSDANFILFRPLRRDGHAIWSALLERSVLVRDCSSWPGLDGCLRVTVGTPEENGVFLSGLAECLS
jgi:histidinol-phosphate aminotransferase